jgi:ferrous iron transport protein B
MRFSGSLALLVSRRSKTASVPVPGVLLRGARRVRIALVGLPGSGTSTLFSAVASTAVRSGPLAQTGRTYEECEVDVGLDQARVTRLPRVRSLRDSSGSDRAALKHLLWGDERPLVSADEPEGGPAPNHAPDVIVQVVDATALERHLELTLELLELGRPVVLAMNRMDEARARGMHIGTRVLARLLGVPVVPTIASMGYGIRELFSAAVDVVRRKASPSPLTPGTPYHDAAAIAETAIRPGGVRERRNWRYWLDELFLSPRWGVLGSAAVFAAVLFVVFDVSAWLDSVTSARLAEWISAWEPQTTPEVIARAVADGLIGLLAIVVPYMIPLVLLLIVLEQVGIMSRIAFAVDRGFHRLGLHGGVALPFLLGLGCNVPALSAIGSTTRGGERTLASLLVTFVPCSARSAIVLALAGKYLGAWGVLAVFAATLVVIAILGRFMRRRACDTPGHIQEIPPYALPRLRPLLMETWLRTREILTIVTPLLIGGSVVLALLHHYGADDAINALLSPITYWWLGLPAALGVPLLFGVLRKELSLLMIFQALGTPDIDRYLDVTQLLTFLLFLTLYVPCISTFAVMLKTIGRREALQAVAISVAVALLVGGGARFVLEGIGLLVA